MIGCVLLAVAQLEVMAQLDCWDFCGSFDIETASGVSQVVDHVSGVAPDSIAWRVNGGSVQLFDCHEEQCAPKEDPLDPRRIPDARSLPGWLRLWEKPGANLFKLGMEEVARRGIRRCAYMPFEENHWFTSKVGGWNLEHPQYWTRTKNGTPLMGRCSLAYPEVREHKLRILDEVLAYGPDSVYIELFRTGGWTVADDYVEPNLAEWRRRYPGEPVPEADDPRWIALVSESQYAFFKDVRRHLDDTGRKIRLLFGIYGMSLTADPNWTLKANDWKRYAREGIADVIVIESAFPDWSRPIESTREIYLKVKQEIGPAQFFCPVMEYMFQKCGIARYADAMGVTKEEVTARLMSLAKEVGAAGVLLECVDYKNYSPGMMRVIREGK